MTRAKVGDQFSAPKASMMLNTLNTDDTESKITFSDDELEVYFSRESNFNHNIWHAVRANAGKSFGMATLVQEVSSEVHDFDPHLSPNGERLYLAPEVGVFNQDIVVAHWIEEQGHFAKPQLVGGINSDDLEADPALSRDELVLIFVSDREDIHDDLFIATRSSTDAAFGNVTKLPAPVNDPGDDRVSDVFIADLPDSCELYFVSDRNFPGTHIYRVQISSK